MPKHAPKSPPRNEQPRREQPRRELSHLRRRFRRHSPRHNRMNIILVSLWAAALGLAVITFIVVFYPPAPPGPVESPIAASSSFNISSSSASSTALGTTTLMAGGGAAEGGASSTASGATSTVTATAPGEFASEYASPYPVNWQDGSEAFSITGASLQGNELMLTLSIQMGSVPACVHANIRLVADEAGTLRTPDAPAGGTFSFPDTQSCNGTPGSVYSATVSFNTTGAASPFLLTTGGGANQYFLAATSTDGGLNISLPPTQG